MADTRHAEAVDAVARKVIYDLTSGPSSNLEELWESYPDLGQHDWERVVAKVRDLVTGLGPDKPAGTYDGAYAFLAREAEGVEP